MDPTITIALSLALSFIAVFTGVLMNNNRLNDVKELLRAEIKASNAELSNLIILRFAQLDARLIHIEERLSRLESDRRVIS